MFQSLVALLIFLTVMMIVCVGIVNRKVVRNRKSVVHLIWTAVFTAACYTAFILVPPGWHRLAVFMDGLYFLATDWLVVYLMLFAAAYTDVHPISKIPRRVIGLLAGVDSISFLINTFTNHMFDLRSLRSEKLNLYYWDVQFRFPHAIHRVFVYSIVLYSLLILLYRLVNSPAIYKNKYSSILVQTASVVGLNILCAVVDTKYDYSVILYASLAISICYLALYASPKKLLERIHSTIVGDSVIGLSAYDNNGKCVGVNRVARELLKTLEADEDIYATAERYLKEWQEEHGDSESNTVGEEKVLEKGSKKLYLFVTYQKFLDEKGRIQGSCFQFENRTEVTDQFRKEQYIATHDTLTGLLNRSAFEEECRRILSQAGEPYCMVCSNIQNFKLVNELYGSRVGDRLLIAQADILKGLAGKNAVSARMYADKFSTLMPKRCFRRQEFLEKLSKISDMNLVSSFRLHYYVGVYEITDLTEPVWTMYDKAVMAIDAIRGNYERSISYYRDELLQRILLEKEILGEFDRAIEEGQFAMFLQPQVSARGELVGAEGLVRWIHPVKGIMYPGTFISTLEKAGLIHKLDLYIWECAAGKLEEWKRKGRGNLSISVNISAKDFYYLDVCEAFERLIERYDFDVKSLKLEITETALMENVHETMKALDGLHALGYEIELDDFGSGYSSLGMLKDIDADILKIDMIFLQETKQAKRSATILKNIITMAGELGMPVITEGVETKEQADFLMEIGCDMFQGYYFAKPMSIEEFERKYFEE